MLGWNFFLFLQEQRRWRKLLENKQSSNHPNPPCFFLAFFPLCVSLDLHMKVIDLGFCDLFIDTKTALRSKEKEGERENEPSTHHNTLSSVLHFLPFPPPLVFFLNFLLLRVVVDPPPSWSYINVTNHNSVSWETQDHLGP